MDRNLRAFIAIAEQRNLTRAAREIGLGQSSLTKKLRQIEAEYGGQLFDRQRYGMELTPLGECLYVRAKKIEQEYGYAKEATNALKSGHLAELRVDAGPTFHLLYVSRVFARLRQEFQQTQLFLTTSATPLPTTELLTGEIDVVVGRIDPDIDETGLIVKPMLTVEHGIVVPKGHPLEKLPVLKKDDLSGFVWIVYGSSPFAQKNLVEYFRTQNLKQPDFAVYTTSFATALQLVNLEGYLMVAPVQLRPIIEAAGVRVLRVDPPIRRFQAGVYTRPTALEYPIIRRFTEVLEQILRDED
ncbi:MAG: LysR family transcriptional regulator [Rhodospirillales bacterium]|nr:LysR family transcriptional regulator [Rhodospirillales bacterium]